ncbi:MAG: S41 family peptidase [Alphaproteobacteria bacterium]|nr:S41 family peptidase [Alphaproteobacteria bacterium]
MQRLLVTALAAIALFGADARAQTEQELTTRLFTISSAAESIQRHACNVDSARLYRGAVDGLNAMPERAGLPPLRLASPNAAGFSTAFTTAFGQAAAAPLALENAAIIGMVKAADPHGSYWDAQSLATGDLWLTLAHYEPTVVYVHAGGPAARAGLQRGDVITAIDGRATTEIEPGGVWRSLRGEPGSSVSLSIERDHQPMTVTLERAEANPESRAALQWRVVDGVGIISLLTFDEHSANAVGAAIRSIREQEPQTRGIILDLRDNGGGLLDQTFEVAGQFIDGGPVARTQPHPGCRRTAGEFYNVQRDGDETGGSPLVVLINARTRNGAELVAAALRERRGATLIGQTTSGEAEVSTTIPIFSSGRYAAASIRVAELLPPSGDSWEGRGLTPDIVVPEGGDGDAVLARALAHLGQ